MRVRDAQKWLPLKLAAAVFLKQLLWLSTLALAFGVAKFDR